MRGLGDRNMDDRIKDLWCAVIVRALMDSVSDPTKRSDVEREHQRVLVKHQAREWFDSAKRDFVIVCTGAGIEPTRLETYAKNLWRTCDAENANGASAVRNLSEVVSRPS